MKVALTVPADRFEDAAHSFREAGFEPVSIPCVEIAVADDQIAEINERGRDADRILVSAARMVRLFAADVVAGATFVCVGSRTAAAVERGGGTAALVGDGGVRAVAERLTSSGWRGTLLYAHGAGADPRAGEHLRQSGIDLVERTAYRAVPVSPSNEPVHAVVFASPSAVEGWCGGRTLEGLTVAAIGATTNGALIDRGLPADVVPAVPGFGEMARELSFQLNFEPEAPV